MSAVFTEIISVTVPDEVPCGSSGKNEAFEVAFVTDGEVPFPQVILRAGGEHVFNGDELRSESTDAATRYALAVPADLVGPGEWQVQVEGCRKADIAQAGGEDWVKSFATVRVKRVVPSVQVGESTAAPGGSGGVIYFGIHKHMHQPYYRAAETGYWDGEKDEIFGSRGGPYTHFIPSAVRQYIDGGLPHAGMSTSWSGSLIAQLNRCAEEGLCGGRFGGWSEALRSVAHETTALGNPRVEFAAFGYYHPLMALIPRRNIVKQIEWHQGIIQNTFGVEASRVLFPPETAFHVRMIPALIDAGIEAVIYDSIHRFRTCRDYPYSGTQEGMLPPNPAEQENPGVDDWFQLHNIWAGSKISPQLLKPEYVKYKHPDGTVQKIVAVPAERYIGNEDARGGFGALQYPDVLGQVYDQLSQHDAFDPKHPPFFLLHSDGDNHGGGAESYYTHNTGQLVDWIKGDPRFELTTVSDYLTRFPPDPDHAVHIEPGAWSGADNGDPQFMKWFSRYTEDYSPDLNSWAVLTALQNAVHTVEDARPDNAGLHEAERLMLRAETSCYWYWTGQEVWDRQVTEAANAAHGLIGGAVDEIVNGGSDRTPPTIFPAWIIPENPGGKTWGQGCLKDAPREAVLHTFVHDVSGIKRVTLVMRGECGERAIDMDSRGLYPCKTGAAVTAGFYTADLPVGGGDMRYYIEAEDKKGNIAQSALERVFLG